MKNPHMKRNQQLVIISSLLLVLLCGAVGSFARPHPNAPQATDKHGDAGAMKEVAAEMQPHPNTPAPPAATPAPRAAPVAGVTTYHRPPTAIGPPQSRPLNSVGMQARVGGPGASYQQPTAAYPKPRQPAQPNIQYPGNYPSPMPYWNPYSYPYAYQSAPSTWNPYPYTPMPAGGPYPYAPMPAGNPYPYAPSVWNPYPYAPATSPYYQGPPGTAPSVAPGMYPTQHQRPKVQVDQAVMVSTHPKKVKAKEQEKPEEEKKEDTKEDEDGASGGGDDTSGSSDDNTSGSSDDDTSGSSGDDTSGTSGDETSTDGTDTSGGSDDDASGSSDDDTSETSGDKASKDETSKDTASKDTASKDTATKDTASKDTATKDDSTAADYSNDYMMGGFYHHGNRVWMENGGHATLSRLFRRLKRTKWALKREKRALQRFIEYLENYGGSIYRGGGPDMYTSFGSKALASLPPEIAGVVGDNPMAYLKSTQSPSDSKMNEDEEDLQQLHNYAMKKNKKAGSDPTYGDLMRLIRKNRLLHHKIRRMKRYALRLLFSKTERGANGWAPNGGRYFPMGNYELLNGYYPNYYGPYYSPQRRLLNQMIGDPNQLPSGVVNFTEEEDKELPAEKKKEPVSKNSDVSSMKPKRTATPTKRSATAN